MTAKKNIIKELRQEIRDLNEELANYKQGMRTREKWFTRVLNTHKSELSLICSQTNNIAAGFKYRFHKELTWLALCDDPGSKFQLINSAITSLRSIARPDVNDD